MSEEEIGNLQRRLLPIEAVMAQLSLGRSSVFELINTNQLRSVKIGRRRLVPQVSIDEFVANLLAASESDASVDAAAPPTAFGATTPSSRRTYPDANTCQRTDDPRGEDV